MNLPTSVVITGCDSMEILQQALHAARSFQPMNSSQVAALLARTAKAAEAGQFELYKTSHQFDGSMPIHSGLADVERLWNKNGWANDRSVLAREAVTPGWIRRTGAGSIPVLAEIRG